MRLIKIAASVIGAAVGLAVGGYLLAEAVLSRYPVAGMPPAGSGATVFVCTNGVHTDLVLPAVSSAMDWTVDLGWPATYFSFGWGDRAFYLETRRWQDLTLSTAWSALFGGGPAVLHVYGLSAAPAGSPDCGALTLRAEQHRALAAYVRASFRRDAGGAVMPLPGSSYGPADLFYEAVGHYSPVETCNAWTGRGLRAAGVTVGLWTPLGGSVMRWVR